ncbi:FkbM family methyltransferase [Neolewinella lacunae]|uniref:FkbM family methyltransferase n=1 Tax=Neolewinella lacunae TaxID=1517758 RepID=A0A923T767_9BACT|nr:FkbM family methyltransferase [Neolewinella lacunae]MBC6994165.1 FkbM family methyltransferase [Neolewinella lacunae]MDN3636686.1 FkbM family methyltransferase [Neolewinella lacunae]
MKSLFALIRVFVARLLVWARLEFWAWKKRWTSEIALSLEQGHRFRFNTYGEIVKILYAHQPLNRYGKGFEYQTVAKFTTLVKPGDVVLDVGANVGMYTLLASKLVGPAGKVYAFEPVHATHGALNENLRLNQAGENVKTFKIALSNANGTAQMSIPTSVGRGSSSDAFNSFQLDTDPSDTGAEVVETIKLDTFVSQHGLKRIDFIKVDIEGAELLFFQGAEEVLQQLRPRYIVFEAFEQYCIRFGYTIADIIVLLKSAGYRVENYAEWQWIGIRENEV